MCVCISNIWTEKNLQCYKKTLYCSPSCDTGSILLLSEVFFFEKSEYCNTVWFRWAVSGAVLLEVQIQTIKTQTVEKWVSAAFCAFFQLPAALSNVSSCCSGWCDDCPPYTLIQLGKRGVGERKGGGAGEGGGREVYCACIASTFPSNGCNNAFNPFLSFPIFYTSTCSNFYCLWCWGKSAGVLMVFLVCFFRSLVFWGLVFCGFYFLFF